jgi:hypothetical protein
MKMIKGPLAPAWWLAWLLPVPLHNSRQFLRNKGRRFLEQTEDGLRRIDGGPRPTQREVAKEAVRAGWTPT